MATPAHCTLPDSTAVAGKNIMLEIYDSTGDKFLAVAGQQGLTINRSADTVETASKDTVGGWKTSIAGMKEWSIDSDGLYVAGSDSHKALTEAFQKSDLVCVKVVDRSTSTPTDMYGGLAAITDYSLEAPYDDAMTYSISLAGAGALTDLSEPATTPEG